MTNKELEEKIKELEKRVKHLEQMPRIMRTLEPVIGTDLNGKKLTSPYVED